MFGLLSNFAFLNRYGILFCLLYSGISLKLQSSSLQIDISHSNIGKEWAQDAGH